jgi:hypothetical protein
MSSTPRPSLGDPPRDGPILRLRRGTAGGGNAFCRKGHRDVLVHGCLDACKSIGGGASGGAAAPPRGDPPLARGGTPWLGETPGQGPCRHAMGSTRRSLKPKKRTGAEDARNGTAPTGQLARREQRETFRRERARRNERFSAGRRPGGMRASGRRGPTELLRKISVRTGGPHRNREVRQARGLADEMTQRAVCPTGRDPAGSGLAGDERFEGRVSPDGADER